MRDRLLEEVAEAFGPRGRWIYTKSKRDRETARIRRAAMWALRAGRQTTHGAVGEVFGYTTGHVCQAIKLAGREMGADYHHQQRTLTIAGGLWDLR